MLEKKEEIKRSILQGNKKPTINLRFLCCSGNQFIVNEAHNQRLVKDNNVFDSASQDIFDSRHGCSFGTTSAPPYNLYF